MDPRAPNLLCKITAQFKQANKNNQKSCVAKPRLLLGPSVCSQPKHFLLAEAAPSKAVPTYFSLSFPFSRIQVSGRTFLISGTSSWTKNKRSSGALSFEMQHLPHCSLPSPQHHSRHRWTDAQSQRGLCYPHDRL